MTIQEGDIKLLKSQIMDDVDEGGGRSNGIAIVDGSSNSIFSDISELDRAYGRVNLRKVFVHVDTPDVDSYFGVNAIIADPPDDPKVSCTLFTTNDGFDHRTDAKLKLESYVVAGPLDNMIPYGLQVIGQRAVLAYQRPEHALPEVGQVFAMATESGVIKQQYFRITTISSDIQNFEDLQGTYQRRVIYMTTSDALRYTFPGEEPQRIFNSAMFPLSARIRKTTVADASRYYGTLPLTLAALTGDLLVKSNGVYTPLVPSSTIETPLVSATIQDQTPVIVSGNQVTYASSVWAGSIRPLYLGGGMAPRSLTITTGAVDTNNPKTDDGAGNVVLPSGSVVGSVDYAQGVIVPDVSSGAWSTSAGITFTYGAAQSQSAFTDSVDIVLSNRGSVYIKTMSPPPAPGTAFVDFMALGKWYRLRDEHGDGVLKGDETAFGAGSINYVTGAVLVTLGALPDIGSSVVFAWGSSVDNHVRTNTASGYFSSVVLSQAGAVKTSVSVSVTVAGVVKTLTESGTGVLAGGGLTGKINYTTGEVTVNGYRDPSTDMSVTYSFGAISTGLPTTLSESFTNIAREVDTTLILQTTSASALIPRTVKLEWSTSFNLMNPSTPIGGNSVATIRLEDDGVGNLKKPDGTILGTVNYATGQLHFQPATSVLVPTPVWVFTSDARYSGGGYSTYTGTQAAVPLITDAPYATTFTVKYQNTASVGAVSGATEVFNAPLNFDLVTGSNENIVIGSVVFKIGSARYIDRAGSIYKDVVPTTGAGSLAGTVDYVTGKVSLSNWAYSATTPVLTVDSCLTFVSQRGTMTANFRTAGAPIRPASFYVQATALDGDLVTGTSDADGNITGTFVVGVVKNTTGVARLAFGNMVVAAGHESDWWYSAGAVVGGMIFRPKPVFANSIQYNAVVTSTLPLDASIIGLDPVRLPSDGRVPVIRAGDMSVIHHTAKTTAQTVSNAQVVNVGRVRLSRLRVFGANNLPITTGFTADLDAGTVTFADVTGYSQPIRVEHRIEDMSMVADAQINGSISLTQRLTHDFPLGAYISSALIIDNMKARVQLIFDQATWNSTFSDSLVGSVATATFNDALAPIVVTNAGAITERWAIQFTNTTTFNLIGEHVGVIGSGNTATDCSPLNPTNGYPYLTIPAVGWGSGWAAGNILRINTIGALYPLWVSRTIQQGPATSQDDSFTVLIRGDIDRP
ncbi:hypothetical protein [Undibacterium sp. Xuan67W]|uniref:hypothetical protein n=1 Tax=Undibacterium sp. Xuan67W TaxID=3413057 RepID=UPI003BEFEE26